MLAAHIPAHVHQLDRVQRAASAPRCRRRVRRGAVERILDRDQPARAGHLAPAGLQVETDVGEQHGVDAVEHSVTHLERFSGQQFLGDAGPQHQRTGQPLALHQLLQRQRRGDVHRLAGVVALAVAGAALDHRLVVGEARHLRDVRQRVDIAAERDHRPTVAEPRHPTARHAGHAARHREAMPLERRGEQFRALDLMKAQFGEGEQRIIDHLRQLGVLVHQIDQAGLQGFGVHVSHGGSGCCAACTVAHGAVS